MNAKTNKSTVECNAYNISNKEAIDLGLIEAIEPNDQVLAQEKLAAQREAAGFKLAQDRLTVLKTIDKDTDGKTCLGVEVSIDETRSGGSRWSSGHVSGYRLIIGCRWSKEKTWVGIGDGANLGINSKQLAKAIEMIAGVKAILDNENAVKKAITSDRMNTEAFIQNNAEFCKLVGQSYFNDGISYEVGHGMHARRMYPTAFIYNPEGGKVRIGSESFTVAQWTEIYALRAAQAEAMKNLKASFTVAA